MPVLCSENTGEIELALGYRFRDKDLLVLSLTHKSYYHENPEETKNCNERLEFLGDSVLGLVIAETLYRGPGGLTEAEMSKMRSYLVNRAILCETALSIGLGGYLRLGRGEEASGGRQKKSVLADALEAVLGAVFLDSDYTTAKSVIQRLFAARIEKVTAKEEGYDFKTELQERCQGIFGVLPEYRMVRQEGEDHRKVFTIQVYIHAQLLGTGVGKSKKEAQMIAAKEALQRLGDG